MVSDKAKRRWKKVPRYTFAAVLSLFAVVALRVGGSWYWSLTGFCTTGFIVVGQRRLVRTGVSRSEDKIVCRYIPWYEGNAYSALVLIPLMGVAGIAAGCAPGNPAWLLWVGIMIVGATLLTVYGIVLMWRRSLLHITPSTLTVRLAERRSELTEIRRELVESIEPTIVPLPYARSLQVAITYRPVDASSDSTKTVIIGLRLSVRPINLLNALVAWKDGANDNPSELLDRIERVVRSRSLASV
jgi:hypothetical protein